MEALFKLWIGNKIKFVVFRNRRIGDRPSAYRILKYYDQERGVRVIPPPRKWDTIYPIYTNCTLDNSLPNDCSRFSIFSVVRRLGWR